MKLARINALLLKYYYISINRVDRLFDVLYWPLIDLIIWGFTSTFINDISELNVLSFLLGGLILWTFVWRASADLATYVLEDFWSRNLYHLFSSPVRLSEHMISIILLGFARSLVTFGALLVLSVMLYSFNFLQLPLFFIATAIPLLLLFGWIVGIAVTALILRYGQRIQVLAWGFAFIIHPFSCVFYPLATLPTWAAFIAQLNPITYVFENLRSALSDGVVHYSQLLYSFFLEILFLILATWFLYRSFEKSKETGLLAKGD